MSTRARGPYRLSLEQLEDRTLLTAGGLDPTFGQGGTARVGFIGSLSETAFAVAAQPDGKLIVVGGPGQHVQSVDVAADFEVARLNADGSLDPSFGQGGRVQTDFGGADNASAVGVQTDGKIVVVGKSGPAGLNTSSAFAVARYNADGSLDTTFGQGGTQLTPLDGSPFTFATDLVLQGDGKIVVAGAAGRNVVVSGVTTFVEDTALVRYNADGSLDASFGQGGTAMAGNSGAAGLDVQADGKFVVMQTTVHQLVRFNTNGTLDTTFGSSGKVVVDFVGSANEGRDVVVQADGKIVALGRAQAVTDFVLSRFNPDGTLDTSFGSNGRAHAGFGSVEPRKLALQSDGKLLTTGTQLGNIGFPETFFATARFNPDGSLDSAFGESGRVITDPGIAAAAYSLALENGQPVVAGVARFRGVLTDFALVRYTTDGALDSAFGTGGTAHVDFQGASNDAAAGFTLQADGKIIQVGTNGVDFALARYNPDGSLDATFGQGGRVATDFNGGDDKAADVVVDNDTILVAGTSDSNYALSRYHTDGSLDTSWGNGGKVVQSVGLPVFAATAVALQPDPLAPAAPKILVAGPVLARFNADGTLDTSFGSGGRVSNAYGQIAVYTDGRIVIPSGNTINTGFAVARYNPGGSLDTSFGNKGVAGLPDARGSTHAMALQPDGKLVAAGFFQSFCNDLPATGLFLIRYLPNGVLDPTFHALAGDPCDGDPATTIALQPDGRIVLAATQFVLRFNPDGTPDATFGTGGRVQHGSFGPVDVAVQTDGKVLASEIDFTFARRDFFVTRFDNRVSQTERFVERTYVDVLGRFPDAGGFAFWTGRMAQGLTHQQLAQAFVGSTEYRARLVQETYQALMHRAADAQGLSAFTNFLAAGGTVDQLKALLIGSTEYYQNRSGGSDEGFLGALYIDVLNRPIDPAAHDAFKRSLAAGASRTALALFVLASREADAVVIASFYRRYLHREPDASGLNALTDALQRGVREEAVIALFIASDEYFARV